MPATPSQCQADYTRVNSSFGTDCDMYSPSDHHPNQTCNERSCPEINFHLGCCSDANNTRCFNIGHSLGGSFETSIENNCNLQYGNASWNSDWICCANGVCAANAAQCPPLFPAAVPEIDADLAAYASVLCRVLNDCGDGNEETCNMGTAEQVAHCREIGCCTFADVPERIE